MGKPDIASSIDNAIQGHPSQLEQVDFLSIQAGNGVVGIGQADKGDLLILPIELKHRGRIGSDGQDFCAAAGEFFIAIAQARQLRATIGSHEPA